ncbi:MAG: hypothetical protein IKH26_04150 [Bacteroidaceae bacterium]|nr:hypothetical protein [Bacteroidaceae bacterium]
MASPKCSRSESLDTGVDAGGYPARGKGGHTTSITIEGHFLTPGSESQGMKHPTPPCRHPIPEQARPFLTYRRLPVAFPLRWEVSGWRDVGNDRRTTGWCRRRLGRV